MTDVENNVGTTKEDKYAKFIALDPSLNVEMFAKWKSKFGKVLATVLNGKVFVYRPITRHEMNLIATGIQGAPTEEGMRQAQQMREEKIFTSCLLHPKVDPTDLGGTLAGTIFVMNQAILRASDYVDFEEVLATTEEL